MAVFGPLPEFVRVSVRLQDLAPDAHAAAARALLARSGAAALGRADAARLAVWREAYAAVGWDVGLPSPPEALLAWAALPGGVPSQGPLLDLVHAFSLQHTLPTAAYDLDTLSGDLWLRPSRGCEWFQPIGGGSPELPAVGELILADGAEVALARYWHRAQGRPTAAHRATRRALVHLDLLGPPAASAEALAEAWLRLATGFLGGRAEVRFLTRATPQAVWSDGLPA